MKRAAVLIVLLALCSFLSAQPHEGSGERWNSLDIQQKQCVVIGMLSAVLEFNELGGSPLIVAMMLGNCPDADRLILLMDFFYLPAVNYDKSMATAYIWAVSQ
jgi:hypothetical protein